MVQFSELKQGAAWQVLVAAAKRAMSERGYKLTREPGRGLSNMYAAENDGKKFRAAIRTTRDRWIAFQPVVGGAGFKTLAEVDLVVVAAVDSYESPKNVEIYLLPADEVRRSFRQAYDARKEAGHSMKDDFGMWVNLDRDNREVYRAGSGLALVNKPIATYLLEELIAADAFAEEEPDPEQVAELATAATPAAATAETIADVLAATRSKIATIAGVATDAVRIDLKIVY
jgi:hypothetical protein